MRAILGATAAIMLLCLGACAAPTRSVTLRFTDAEGQPLPGAHVRLIAVGTSDTPLPITFETLGELLAAPGLAEHALTDADGLARLRLLAKRRHTLEVQTPPIGEDAGAGERTAMRWLLDPDGRTLTAPIDQPHEQGIRAEVVR